MLKERTVYVECLAGFGFAAKRLKDCVTYEKRSRKTRWIDVKFSEFADLPVIDCHVHFSSFDSGGVPMTGGKLRQMGEFIVEVIEKGMLSQMYVSGRDAGLYLKVKYPGLFYAGGFVPWSGRTVALPSVEWKSYVASLFGLGFEGIGEMGNKPAVRSSHQPLDGDYYRGFWNACEELGFPVLCHVADPEEFWDENLAPDWAKQRRWVYYLDDYPLKEELYGEMENVLDAHPNLKIVLAHFYFLSADLERAAEVLGRYKHANFDLTLGIELMYNISHRRDDWRDFFIKHQDRIFFGTDIATWQTVQQAIDRIWLIRNFLESDEEFFTPSTADNLLTRYEEPFIGLNLPEGALKKIYAENFQRLWGNEPEKVNVDAAIRTLEEKGEKTISEALRSLL
ncbi:MAG: amidohydrolase family protein [Candidatus Bathyarchaeota archaeon]|nr:amidohydrolase family protein [Candidatus Bathyarchaeota archaeon]